MSKATMGGGVLVKAALRRSLVPAFPAIDPAEEFFDGLAMPQFDEFETDLSAAAYQVPSRSRREFCDNAQHESDSFDRSDEVPERNTALGHSQKSLR